MLTFKAVIILLTIFAVLSFGCAYLIDTKASFDSANGQNSMIFIVAGLCFLIADAVVVFICVMMWLYALAWG